MPISRQKQKKGERRGAELPPNDKNIAPANLPHIHITPSLTTFASYAQLSYPHPRSHTPWFQKHNTSHPQQERVTRNEKSGGSFFPSQKESNQRFVWIYWLEDEKDTQHHDLEIKRECEIKTNIK